MSKSERSCPIVTAVEGCQGAEKNVLLDWGFHLQASRDRRRDKESYGKLLRLLIVTRGSCCGSTGSLLIFYFGH